MSDVLDHITSVVEDMEVLSEDARDLIDLIFNTISHQNNASMQMLAVMSTIFLPITFIAGVYGTNFDQYFPEIHWQVRW
jgi:Mg2+ and Co2+ transporter CorA